MNKSLLFAFAFAFISTALPAWAVNVTGNATATIKKALTATEATPMAFATIQAPTTGGTVTISPAGAVSTAASGFTFSGSPTAGVFTITGDNSAALTVTFTNGSLTLSGASPMALQNFKTNPTGASITTNSSGTLSLSVGADLIVGANQNSGNYAGTYTVTVSY